MKRHIKLFEDFGNKQKYWLLIHGEDSSSQIFDDHDEAMRAEEELHDKHRDYSRQMFISYETTANDEFIDEHPGKSQEELEEIAGRLFDTLDYEYGEPPRLIGPFDPTENDYFLIRQLKEMVAPHSFYDPAVVRRLIELGVDPEKVFSGPDHAIKFFEGDVGWWPKGIAFSNEIRRGVKSNRLFGI